MLNVARIDLFTEQVEPYAVLLRKVLGYLALLSIPIGWVLAGIANVLYPHLHTGFWEERISLAGAFWLVVAGTFIGLTANAIPFALDDRLKEKARERTSFEAGRFTLYTLLFFSVVVTGAIVSVLAGRPMASFVTGVLVWSCLIVNVAVGTISFAVKRRTQRGAWVFAYRAVTASVGYASMACNIVLVVGGLWSAHRLHYAHFWITPFVVALAYLLAFTLASLSAAHRRLSGAVAGTGMTLGVMLLSSPHAFIDLLMRIGHVQ